jgi:hypothetical protein
MCASQSALINSTITIVLLQTTHHGMSPRSLTDEAENLGAAIFRRHDA